VSIGAAVSQPVDTARPGSLLYKVIVDRTLGEGASFFSEAARRGAAVQSIGGDISDLWISDLEPRWKTAPAAIAGLTKGTPLFCLELLARDYGMRLVYRIEHAVAADGRIGHSVRGPHQLSSWTAALAAQGKHWGTLAAALVTRPPLDSDSSTGVDLLDLSARSKGTEPSCFSWLIAPGPRPSLRSAGAVWSRPRVASARYGDEPAPTRSRFRAS
jgi:hypothetical protein